MSKYLLKVNSNKTIYPSLNLGYIFGLDKFSIGFDKTFDVDYIKNFVINNSNKEIFVCLNKMIYNHELEEYKDILFKLDAIGLTGIIVGDIAALTYNLNTNLILDQLHLNNSYLTINHYYKNGVTGTYLTNDITLDEINEIKANSKSILFKEVFGHSHLSTSARRFVTNYKKHFNIIDDNKKYYIKENNHEDDYLVCEDNFGTNIYDNKVLDLFSYKEDIKVDYLVINGFNIDEKIVNKVCLSFVNNDVNLHRKICKDIKTSVGFINKKTMYKVKKNDK